MKNIIKTKKTEDTLTVDFIGNDIEQKEFDSLLKGIKKLNNSHKIYVNIANLYEISNATLKKFREMRTTLKDEQICFINVSAMNNMVLNLFNIDKLFQLYINKQDAVEGTRPVINRNFKVV